MKSRGYGLWVMGYGFFLLPIAYCLLPIIVVSAQQVVFSPGSPAPWDNGDVEPGAVIKDGSLFKMWFTGFDGKKYRIGYATSKDGINWERLDTAVFDIGTSGSWDDAQAAYPFVMKDGNLYKMWYAGVNVYEEWQIGYAEKKYEDILE